MFEHMRQIIEARTRIDGVKAADLLELPAPLGPTLSKIIRNGTITLPELAADLGTTEPETRQLVALLIDKGVLQIGQSANTTTPHYAVRLAPTRATRRTTSNLNDLFGKL
jgi:hypothetical protein